MALPTTNLTSHFNASDSDHVFEDTGASNTCENTDALLRWTDDDGKLLRFVSSGAVTDPHWQSTPMILPACDFGGSTDTTMALTDNTEAVAKTLDDVTNNNAKTVILSLQLKGATLNDAASYNNHWIFADAGKFFGLFGRTSGGLYYLQAYNWDGNEDKVERQISLNTTYIVTIRHDGTNLYLGLDGEASPPSTASGNTSTMTGTIRIGGSTTAQYANIVIGELCTWDAFLTGTNLSDANSYFTSKWLAAAPSIPWVMSDNYFPKPFLRQPLTAGRLR